MPFDILGMFESLAQNGTAPEEGCSLFGVGHEVAFEALERKYLLDRFSRGLSAQKFIVGPFGSGKTHFLRQLSEIGRARDCVTVEVKLNKNLDYAQGLVVYQEIAREVRPPGQDYRGLRPLLLEAVRRQRRAAEDAQLPPDEIVAAWVAGLTEQDFDLPAFGRVMRRGLQDHIDGNPAGFEAAVRWLGGDVTDRSVAKELGESVLPSAEIRVFAHRATLSLYRFIRHAGFRGTIVGFDEAEQGIDAERKKRAKIFSQLLAGINAIIDLKDSPVLVMFAVTPDIMAKIGEEMPMLQQRLADPGEGMGFFDGNVLAPTIDLTRPSEDSVEELGVIGSRLVRLFFERVPDADIARRDEAMSAVAGMAEQVRREEQSSSARRLMVRRVCTPLVNSYRTIAEDARNQIPSRREPEV